MAKELSVLQQQAEAIKTEVNKGANTSSRIGGMFGDMLEYNEERLTELGTLKSSDSYLLNNRNYSGYFVSNVNTGQIGVSNANSNSYLMNVRKLPINKFDV